MDGYDLIQKTAAVIKEECIFAFDDILDKDGFRQAIEDNQIIQSWEKNCEEIKQLLKKILSEIAANNIAAAYHTWEIELNQMLLGNNTYQQISLLVLGGLNSSTLDMRYTSKEYDTLTKTGILTSGRNSEKDAIGALFQKSISSEWMQRHLDLMLWDIWSSEVQVSKTSKELVILFYNINKVDAFYRYITKDARQDTYKRLRLNKTLRSFTLKEFIYGDNPQWKGQAADAFLQHLAHMHTGIFIGSSGFQNITNIEDQPSVFREEQSNIFELLLQSKNNTSWYTGGDLILKLGSGQILNIQLKTQGRNLSKQKQQLNSRITTNQLKVFLGKLQLYFDNIQANKDKLIELLFNELKTSAWIEQQASPVIASAVAKEFAK